LIRQLCPVLAALHERGIAHGVLTPERIVITPDGRVVLVEHVLASAIDALKLPTSWMRTELGLAVPSGNGRIDLDGRSDIVQLGFIALSLAVGQRLEAAAYPERIGRLIGDRASNGGMPPTLRRWLERSLHLVWPPFSSALEASAALDELPEHREPAGAAAPPESPVERPRLQEHRDEPGSNVIAIRSHSQRTARAEPPKPAPIAPPVVTVTPPAAPYFPDETELPPSPPAPVKPLVTVERQPERAAERPPQKPADDGRRSDPVDVKIRAPEPVEPPVDVRILFADETRIPPSTPETKASVVAPFSPELLREAFGDEPVVPASGHRGILTSKGFVAAVLTVALLEAVIIAGLLFSRSTSPSATDAAAVQPAPSQTASNTETAPSASVQPASGQRSGTPNRPAPTAAASAANAAGRQTPAAERTGTVRFSSPVALDVFANGTRIGTTDGPLSLAAGRHALELVNQTLGYRGTQNITVAAGGTVSRAITLPQGRLNINADPWATVSVDGRAVGETPLANLPLQIGSHEVTFRHPVFGEKRETTIVKADGVTRVSVNMQQR
jgi:hypothetical protein